MRDTSLTAFVVTTTVARLGATRRWGGVLDPEAVRLADVFRRHAPDTPSARLVAALPTPVLLGALEASFVPGMAWHYLFRKAWIEAEARRAIAEGAGQLLVLGAGFDTLALRLARSHPGLAAVEIDRPGTMTRKRAALDAEGVAAPPGHRLLDADLAEQPLDAVLAGTLAPDVPTVVVLEGVLMYLRESDVTALLRSLHGLFWAGLTVLFGAIATPDAEGGLRQRVADHVLARGGERTRWACPRERMEAFLAPVGFRVAEAVSYRALQRPHRPASALRRVPEDDEGYYRAVRV